MHPRSLQRLAGLALVAALLCPALWAMAQNPDGPAPAPADSPPPAKAAAPGAGLDARPDAMPHVRLSLPQRYVDIDAAVCLTEGPLELLVTVPAGKEHEAAFTLKARPPHVHVCLLMLGLQSGSPGRWTYENKVPKPVDATGDRVAITVLYQKDGKTIERPIGEFARDAKTGKTVGPSTFVFAGSRVVRPDAGEPFYGAEVSGDVVTLVSFEDEMLAAPRAASSANDDLQWVANTEALPPVGTPVTLRLRPAPRPQAKPADTPAPAPPAHPAPKQ